MIPGKAACLVVAAAATASHVHGFGADRAGHLITRAQAKVHDALVGPRFTDAAVGLQRYHDFSGTYDGASLDGQHIVLKWGNTASYCLEGVSESNGVQHLVGPQGSVAAGPCPRWAF